MNILEILPANTSIIAFADMGERFLYFKSHPCARDIGRVIGINVNQPGHAVRLVAEYATEAEAVASTHAGLMASEKARKDYLDYIQGPMARARKQAQLQRETAKREEEMKCCRIATEVDGL